MAALTQPYETFERPGLVMAYQVAATTIYKGALVALNGSGYLVPLGPGTAGLKFVGVANETVDNSGGSAGDKRCNVTKAGSFVVLPASGFTPAQGDLGSELLAASDWEAQISASGLGNSYAIGTLTALEGASTGATGMRVRIDNHTV
jgi:hypothetical protein